jgi:hypothetical protein
MHRGEKVNKRGVKQRNRKRDAKRKKQELKRETGFKERNRKRYKRIKER